ncbi:hypothetical protein [Ekhidna sp.]|uniref:hypothetical protein n=1 Tax=Ekhidna sp. TaxID=2608089 RepID=UPI003BAC388B
MFLCVPFLIDAQDRFPELIEVEQRIFNAEDIHLVDSLLFVKAGIYKGTEQFDLALKTLDRISFANGSRLEVDIINERILINYLIGNHINTQNLLLEAEFIEGYERSNTVRIVEILNYVSLEQFEEAENKFQILIQDSSRVEEVFDVKNLKNPNLAFTLSFIVPGSGQMYAGKVFKGLISLGVQTALFYTGVNGLYRGYPFTESIPAIALFQGFYFGGAEYAKNMAVEKNREIVDELSLDILREIKK